MQRFKSTNPTSRQIFIERKLIFESSCHESCDDFFMVGFTFDNGGRRCIRPILEKYQSGKESIMFILTV